MRNLLVILLVVSMPAWCEVPVTSSTEAIINLPVTDTWKLFSTAEGLQDMGYANTSMSLQLDGEFHAEKTVNAQSEVLDGVIASYDPGHMLSWRWNKSSCWSVLYFNAMGTDMTQIRWLDLCSVSSADLKTHAQYHRNLFDQLIRHYAPECHVCKEEREAAKHP